MFENRILVICIPYEKVKLWENDSVTFLKMGLGVFFKKSLKKGVLFQTILKKGPIFKLSLKKYPTRLGPGSWALAPVHPGPGPRVGYFFKNSLKMHHFLKIVWKTTPFFKLFRKTPPDPFSKMSRSHFFKVSPFHKGCKSIGMLDQSDISENCFRFIGELVFCGRGQGNTRGRT